MKDIPSFENKYAITKNGEVWSYYSKNFMKIKINDKGYKSIGLRKNG